MTCCLTPARASERVCLSSAKHASSSSPEKRALILSMSSRSGTRSANSILGLPISAAQDADGFHLRLDGLVSHFHAGDHVGLVHLGAARLHHADGVGGAGHHQVDRAGIDLLERGVDHPGAVHFGHAHGADGSLERGLGQAQRRGGAGQRQHVIRVDLVHRQHGGHDVRLFVEARRPERSHRPIDQTGVQDGLIAGAPFLLDETAGDLPGSVHALFHVHREREEVHVALVLGDHRGDQHHGVPAADQDRSTRLLGQSPRFEGDGLPPQHDLGRPYFRSRTTRLRHSCAFPLLRARAPPGSDSR